MGTPYFAVPILKSLYQNGYPISVVYTQPPKKSHRGQKINKSPVQSLSETLNIECRTPSSLRNNIEEKNDQNVTYEEGCLSVPNQFAEIDRPKTCEVEYLDYNGNKQNLKAEGLLATCIQHEIDHLEGILFIDYLSKLKKEIIVKKLSKQKVKSDRIVV